MNELLTDLYKKKVAEHNLAIETSSHCDSGFDILQPSILQLERQSIGNKLKLGIKVAVTMDDKPMPFYLYPRSSISKTGMRLANSVGIIDSGYRGELMAVVDNIASKETDITSGDRYFQICMGDLHPFRIEIVNSVEELGNTERGEGGFGSTGTHF